MRIDLSRVPTEHIVSMLRAHPEVASPPRQMPPEARLATLPPPAKPPGYRQALAQALKIRGP